MCGNTPIKTDIKTDVVPDVVTTTLQTPPDNGTPYARPAHVLTLLVAGEHPDLDAGERQVRDRLGHAVLQLVLDRRRAHQRHPLLDLLVHGRQLVVAVLHRRAARACAHRHTLIWRHDVNVYMYTIY